MSYPITPDPSIHSLPPSIAKRQNQQAVQAIEASAKRLVQSIINAVLSLLTGGLLGTGKTASGDAGDLFSNLFGNLFSMLGIPDPATILATVEQDVFDTVSTVTGFVNHVLAPTGILSLGADVQTFLDGLWSGLTGQTGTGKSHADVANAAAVLQGTVVNHSSTLAIRDNSPASVGLTATEESVFPITTITSGSPVFLNVTSSNAVMGFIRCGQAVNKDVVSWLGKNTANLTGIYISIYKMDTATGDLTLEYESGNYLTSVSTLLSWSTCVIPIGSWITASPGDVYGIEIAVTGTGTYAVVGIDHTWMPDHPSALPKQFGAYRDNGNSGSAPGSILGTAISYATTSVPWFGFGVDAGGFHAPASISYSAAGTGSYAIPPWANFLDIVAMGGGGGGSYGGAFASNGQGGTGGAWNAVTVAIGTDIPATTPNIDFSIGAGGIEGGPATSGSSTTVSATGWSSSLTATGGAPGTVIAVGLSTTSYGAGNETFNGSVYYGGGTVVTSGAAGNSPGGGGAGGVGGQFSGYRGGNGADGVVWITARSQ